MNPLNPSIHLWRRNNLAVTQWPIWASKASSGISHNTPPHDHHKRRYDVHQENFFHVIIFLKCKGTSMFVQNPLAGRSGHGFCEAKERRPRGSAKSSQGILITCFETNILVPLNHLNKTSERVRPTNTTKKKKAEINTT